MVLMANLANTKTRTIQWIPTWQCLDGFQKCLLPFSLDESSLRIERVQYLFNYALPVFQWLIVWLISSSFSHNPMMANTIVWKKRPPALEGRFWYFKNEMVFFMLLFEFRVLVSFSKMPVWNSNSKISTCLDLATQLVQILKTTTFDTLLYLKEQFTLQAISHVTEDVF